MQAILDADDVFSCADDLQPSLPFTSTLAHRQSVSGERELQEEVVMLNELNDIRERLDVIQKSNIRALHQTEFMSAVLVLVSLYIFVSGLALFGTC